MRSVPPVHVGQLLAAPEAVPDGRRRSVAVSKPAGSSRDRSERMGVSQVWCSDGSVDALLCPLYGCVIDDCGGSVSVGTRNTIAIVVFVIAFFWAAGK